MKIVQKGLFEEEGIFMRCDYCKGVFLIEGREDFSGSMWKTVTYKNIYNYNVQCPMCSTDKNLGCIDHPEISGTYSHLRRRNDWNKRYKIAGQTEAGNVF